MYVEAFVNEIVKNVVEIIDTRFAIDPQIIGQIRKRNKHNLGTIITVDVSKHDWVNCCVQIYYNHPYCVNDDEIRATFEDDFKVESVDETVFLQDEEYVEDEQNSVPLKLLRRAKVPSISDRVYVLSKK